MREVAAEAAAIRPDEGKRNFVWTGKERQERVRGGVAESQVADDRGQADRGESLFECSVAERQREQKEKKAEAQRETQGEEQGIEDEKGEARAQKICR